MKCISRSTIFRSRLCRVLVAVLCSGARIVHAGSASPCIAVAGDRFAAKDLIPANPWFTEIDPNIEVGMTPLAGVTRVLRGQELVALAKSARQGPIPISFSDICVERATRPLSRERLQPVLDAALGEPVTVLEFSHYPLPAGDLEFTRAGLAHSGLWRGRLIYGVHHSLPVWATIQTVSGTVQGRTREVEHGDRVAVEVTSGAARLTFEAIAESSGRAGESVLLHNPDNGHIFLARVLSERKVCIHK